MLSVVQAPQCMYVVVFHKDLSMPSIISMISMPSMPSIISMPSMPCMISMPSMISMISMRSMLRMQHCLWSWFHNHTGCMQSYTTQLLVTSSVTFSGNDGCELN